MYHFILFSKFFLYFSDYQRHYSIDDNVDDVDDNVDDNVTGETEVHLQTEENPGTAPSEEGAKIRMGTILASFCLTSGSFISLCFQ